MVKPNDKLGNLIQCDERLKFLLTKCEDAEDINLLIPSELEELWQIIREILLTYVWNSETIDNLPIMMDILSVILSVVKTEVMVASNPRFVDLLRICNEKTLNITDDKLHRKLYVINKIWLVDANFPTISALSAYTLRSLICTVLVKNPSANDLEKLETFREQVSAQYLDDSTFGFQILFKQLVTHPKILYCDAGYKFISYVAPLSDRQCQNIQVTIEQQLFECNEETAIKYGKFYINAWYGARIETKPYIEKCMQTLVELFINHRRNKITLDKRFCNVQAAINTWNIEVLERSDPNFISAIANCYKPILWEYLTREHGSFRLNAIDLLHRAFPLQYPGDPSREFFDEQCDSFASALKDKSELVRTIAVKGICANVQAFWNMFNADQIQNFFTILTKVNACDDYPEIRRSVWSGLTNFVSSASTYDNLKQLLPGLKHQVEKVNQEDMLEFLNLLIAINEKKDPSLTFTVIAPVATLMRWLANAKRTIGRYILRLVLPSFYSKDMDEKELVISLVDLIKVFPGAYRNFFLFTKKALSLDESISIMCTLLSHLGELVLERLTAANDWQYDQVQNYAQSGSSANTHSSGVLDDDEVVMGLFDIITLLWVLRENQLRKPKNEEKRRKLYDTYFNFIHAFISFFKGKHLFNSVITLSIHVPYETLSANMVTLPDDFLKEITSIKITSLELSYGWSNTMLTALIKWGRGYEILNEIESLIESAFASSDEASLSTMPKRMKISEMYKPKSLVAIYILDLIINTDFLSVIIQNNYDKLRKLWNTIGNVRDLILKRLEVGEPFSDPMLSDEFLINCYSRHIQLISLLSQPTKCRMAEHPNIDDSDESDDEDVNEVLDIEDNDKFIPGDELTKAVEWAKAHLVPYLDKLVGSQVLLLATLLNSLLSVCENMMMRRMLPRINVLSNAMFSDLSLLSSEQCLHFILSASKMTAALIYFANMTNDDEIWGKTIPGGFCSTLKAMADKYYTEETLKYFKKEFICMKAEFGHIYERFEKRFKPMIPTSIRARPMHVLIVNTIIALRKDLGRFAPRSDFTIPVYSSYGQLPKVANVILSPCFKNRFWTQQLILKIKNENTYYRSVKTLLIDLLILNFLSKLGDPTNNSIIKESMQCSHHYLDNMNWRNWGRYPPRMRLVHEEEREDEDSSEEEVDDNDDESFPCEVLRFGLTVTNSAGYDMDAMATSSETLCDHGQHTQPNPVIPENELIEDYIICCRDLLKEMGNYLTPYED